MTDKLVCSCGKKKPEYRDNCWLCKEKDEVRQIWDYSKNNGQITSEKYVICPYCGFHYGEDDLHESMRLTCDECEKEFKLEVEYEISYSTYRVKDD